MQLLLNNNNNSTFLHIPRTYALAYTHAHITHLMKGYDQDKPEES